MRRALALAMACLSPACSLVGVERTPKSIAPEPPVHCTDTYWLPAADAVAVAIFAGLFAWSVDQCQRDADNCDGQVGLVLLDAIPFAASAGYGVTKVRGCRRAKEWQRETPRPRMAGRNGAACVPVYGRADGRCDAGYCVRGLCQAEMPLGKLRQFCAEPIAVWRAGRNPARRSTLHASLPPACRPLAR